MSTIPSSEMLTETKICCQCQKSFPITDKDLEFYDKVSPVFNGQKFPIPTPTLCPDCRQQRRLAWRNERKLYKRNCDATGKEIISIYSPDKNLKVYHQDEWWSDKWDALGYGKDFNFSESFYSQFQTLLSVVPNYSLISRNSENSEYTNISAFNKNSYLLIESSNNENCLFGYWLQNSKNIVDSSFLTNCDNCYKSIDLVNCFQCENCMNCSSCSNSIYLIDCVGCQDCIGCVGINNKQFYFLNKMIGKDAFEKLSNDLKTNPALRKETEKNIKELLVNTPKMVYHGGKNQNSTGDYLINTKNCSSCFELNDAWDCKNSVHVLTNSHSCVDVDTVGLNASYVYESINTAIDVFKNSFCIRCWTGSDLLYSFNLDFCKNCFGCIGLRNKQYCILNKQYTKEEYETLVPKIIEKMIADGEWGEFFPASLSPFGYNETVASEYFPLEKEEALKLSFNWSDYETPFPKVEKIIPASKLPDDISKIPDDILNWAIECEVSNKPFRIIKQELEFYRKHNLPIPRRHPDQRHKDRMELRNPRKLFERTCDKCQKDILTTYAPERTEIVYCESCYNNTVT